jgi:hypothetical protein
MKEPAKTPGKRHRACMGSKRREPREDFALQQPRIDDERRYDAMIAELTRLEDLFDKAPFGGDGLSGQGGR